MLNEQCFNPLLCFSSASSSPSRTPVSTLAEGKGRGWMAFFFWGAANVICYNLALIWIFSTLLGDSCELPELASILTKPRPASTVLVSHDRCFPGPPDISGRSHGRLSSLVNFAPSAPLLLAYEYPHRDPYSPTMHEEFKKWSFFRGNVKGPEGMKRRKECTAAWQDVFTAVVVMN